MRTFLGLLTGYLAWTALWLGGNAGLGALYPDEFAAFHEGGSLTLVAPLAWALALSVLCSLLGGALAERVARSRTAALLLALALVGTGILVQAEVWDRMPETYHWSFLVLLMPTTLLGAQLASRPNTP